MVDNAERKILDMVEKGQISAEEGLRLINAMSASESSDGGTTQPETPTRLMSETGTEDVKEAADVVIPTEPEGMHSDHPQISPTELNRMKRLKRWWVLPFGIGLLITTLGAVWMYMGYEAARFGFGFWLAWIPFLLGIFIVVVSFQSSRSIWLHVRIRQAAGQKPERIAISLPLPLNLARWIFSNFGSKIPGIKDQPMDAYAEILDHLSPEDPFYVHVQEDDGEEVEVFIG